MDDDAAPREVRDLLHEIRSHQAALHAAWALGWPTVLAPSVTATRRELARLEERLHALGWEQ